MQNHLRPFHTKFQNLLHSSVIESRVSIFPPPTLEHYSGHFHYEEWILKKCTLINKVPTPLEKIIHPRQLKPAVPAPNHCHEAGILHIVQRMITSPVRTALQFSLTFSSCVTSSLQSCQAIWTEDSHGHINLNDHENFLRKRVKTMTIHGFPTSINFILIYSKIHPSFSFLFLIKSVLLGYFNIRKSLYPRMGFIISTSAPDKSDIIIIMLS